MNDASPGGDRDADWEKLRPVLDQELHHLDEREREAILLRFFDERSFSGIGEILHLSEDAARKRVERALERLRGRLVKRGITSTTAALTAVLAGQVGLAAPAGLVESVAGAALASAAGGVASPIGILQIMSAKSTMGIAGALGLAGLVGIGGLGTAVYEFRAARLGQASLLAARHEYEAKQAHLQELKRGAEAAQGRVMEIRHDIDRIQAASSAIQGSPGAAAATSDAGRDPKADGKRFMEAFPQARGLLMGIAKAQISVEFAPFYRSAGLTPAQIAQFEDQTSALWVNSEVVTPNSTHPSIHDLPDDQLRQILGDQGLAQFQEFSRGLDSAYELSLIVGARAGYTAEPLSPAQVDQLAQIVVGNSASYQSGDKLDWGAVNWDGVAGQAKSLLTPAQWQAAEGIFIAQQLTQAVTLASNNPIAVYNSQPPVK
jgi:hypothetical protein